MELNPDLGKPIDDSSYEKSSVVYECNDDHDSARSIKKEQTYWQDFFSYVLDFSANNI